MIFIIVSKHPENDDGITKAIGAALPDNFYEIGRGQWLVSFDGTSKELFSHVFPDNMTLLTRQGGLIVLGTTGYWGRSPTDTWEWLASRSGAKGA